MGAFEKWFEENAREFPWRQNPTPYRVWISEVMLQQTRASVVIPYFLRWVELFPDVKALYKAPLDKVIKAWEGLGYYSRARNLHQASREIVERFSGEIPSTYEDLSSLPGFGPYTIGAVLSFAFHKRALAIDGNVLRVISRLFCIEKEIFSARKIVETCVESLLDGRRPWVTMEGLIELGATVCVQSPRCDLCPLAKRCQARMVGKELLLPIRKPKEKVEELKRAVFVIMAENKVLVRKVGSGEVMADLYEFPYVEMLPRSSLEKQLYKLLGKEAKIEGRLDEQRHTFTRYKCRLFPFLVTVRESPVEGHEWVSLDQVTTLPFSSGHRKICNNFLLKKQFLSYLG